jgi:raffinose/stachyose/melibiose transport system permease protein
MKKISEKHYVGFFILGAYSLFTLFTILLLFYNSIRDKSDFLKNTLGIPKKFTLVNYYNLFVEGKFHRYVFNSAFILVISLFLLISISSLTAYGLGRYRFKYKNGVLLYFLLGLMFPVQLGILPVFLIIKNLGLFNTYWSVILVLSAGISMPVLLLTTFFENLPPAIYESGKMDGASEWKIFYKIMFPMATPVIFSVCIIMSVGIWNQFFLPVIFLQNEEIKTIPLAIMKYSRKMLYSIDLALASSVVATVPLLIVFFIFSKQILSSIVSGGVKG